MLGIISDYPQLSGTIIKDFTLKKDESSKIFDIYTNDDFILINSKIGKIYSCLTTQYLIDHYAPDTIINIGVIVGFGDNISIGDVIVGNNVNQKEDVPDEGQHLDYFKKEMFCEPLELDYNFDDFKVITGLCMADESVAHNENLAEKYKEKLRAIDVQAFTIAAVCNIYGKDLVVVKGVAEKIEDEKDKNELKAMESSIKVLDKISNHFIKA